MPDEWQRQPVRISRVHWPVTALGVGRRVGIWLQGCRIQCAGCISRDTWDSDGGSIRELGPLVDQLSGWLAECDGVTISGGEPFDQPEALLALLRILHARCIPDILVFSGYEQDDLESRFPQHLPLIDVLITGPYDPAAGDRLALRGSDNQRVNILSTRATTRYPVALDEMTWQEWEPMRRIDAHIDETTGTIWMAGIPPRGLVAALGRALQRRGLEGMSSQQQMVARPGLPPNHHSE